MAVQDELRSMGRGGQVNKQSFSWCCRLGSLTARKIFGSRGGHRGLCGQVDYSEGRKLSSGPIGLALRGLPAEP